VERADSLLSVLDHRQSCAGCGAITFKCAFGVLQQERLVRLDIAFDPTFADSHHPPEHGLVRCFAPSPLARSFVSPPWPAQTARIARAAPDPITLLVG
jgi:hypothetical protein